MVYANYGPTIIGECFFCLTCFTLTFLFRLFICINYNAYASVCVVFRAES